MERGEEKPIKEGKRGGGSPTALRLNFTYGKATKSMNLCVLDCIQSLSFIHMTFYFQAVLHDYF